MATLKKQFAQSMLRHLLLIGGISVIALSSVLATESQREGWAIDFNEHEEFKFAPTVSIGYPAASFGLSPEIISIKENWKPHRWKITFKGNDSESNVPMTLRKIEDNKGAFQEFFANLGKLHGFEDVCAPSFERRRERLFCGLEIKSSPDMEHLNEWLKVIREKNIGIPLKVVRGMAELQDMQDRLYQHILKSEKMKPFNVFGTVHGNLTNNTLRIKEGKFFVMPWHTVRVDAWIMYDLGKFLNSLGISEGEGYEKIEPIRNSVLQAYFNKTSYLNNTFYNNKLEDKLETAKNLLIMAEVLDTHELMINTLDTYAYKRQDARGEPIDIKWKIVQFMETKPELRQLINNKSMFLGVEYYRELLVAQFLYLEKYQLEAARKAMKFLNEQIG